MDTAAPCPHFKVTSPVSRNKDAYLFDCLMARMQLFLTLDQMSRHGFQVSTRVSLVGCYKELLDL